MNTYAFLIKAKAKSDKKSLFCWFSAKSDSRAEREIANILEDAEIETGRGADYVLPTRTDWHVVNDLPEEGVLDNTWCDRYELNDDGRSWSQIPCSAPAGSVDTSTSTSTSSYDTGTISIDQTTFIQRVLGCWLFGSFTKLFAGQQRDIASLQHDMEASYPQNVLLALNNAKDLLQLQHCFPETLFDLIHDIKSIWPTDGKAPDVGSVLTFAKEWINSHNNASNTEGVKRADVTAKWLTKQYIKRTHTGATAGGKQQTDRSGYTHDLDTLDIEIALATLPFDFNIYNLPGPVYRRAKEIVAKSEEPFRAWSSKLRAMPGILDVSRAGILALVRGAAGDITHFPDSMQRYINATLTADYYTTPTPNLLAPARNTPVVPATPENIEKAWDDVEAAISTNSQPEIKNVGGGMFSIDGLMAPASNEGEKPEHQSEDADDVQMEETVSQPNESSVTIPEDEKTDADTLLPATVEEAAAGLADAIKRWTADIPPKSNNAAEPGEPLDTDEPPYFEPGRYEGLSINAYHAANGISSTQVKDARISLMYYHGRHITKTIRRDSSDALTFGSLVHTLALEPEKLEEEYATFPVLPQGTFTNTESMVKFIREYNATLTPSLSSDEIKSMLEEYNATLPAPVTLGGSVDDIGNAYMRLPDDFKTIPADAKFTATAMKACIKEYNATLPVPLKTTGSRDALIEQLSIIKPTLVAEEMAKPLPLNVSGSKETLAESIRTIKPDAIFADEFERQWLDGLNGKTVLTGEQLQIATAIQQALFNHPTAGKLLQHTARAVEVSYFGMDEGTGLEVRVRPDLELELDGLRISADVKTISLGKVKQDNLRAKLHCEIIDRDYHVSAAMYSEVADFDQFFWIFVNKDEGYHWVAVIEASADLLELGSLEYHRTTRELANAYDTDTWPALVTTDYTDELNDFDLRRLEALRVV